jgi:hypothetical protein
MATYASKKYAFSGTGLTGVALTANDLSDLASDSTARTNLGLVIGTDVQAFVSADLGTNGNGARTVDTAAPSGGSDGDIWYKYS